MAKIAVLGDAFIDNYIVGTVRGMSAEVPIPIVDVISSVQLPGGSGNVVMNIDSLGGDVFYLEHEDQTYPVKNRLMTKEGQQLARWDEDDHCKPYTRADLLDLMDADAVIVSDYCKGSINEEVIQILRSVADVKPVFVDTKGDPSAWIGSDVTLFPNLAEYGRYNEKYNWFPKLVLKRGAEGVAFLSFGSVVAQRGATATHVNSVNGAGDTIIAAFTLAAIAGLTTPECLDFANAAAGLVVSQPFLKRTTTREEVLDVMFGPTQESVNEQTHYSERRGGVSRYGIVLNFTMDGVSGPSCDAGNGALGQSGQRLLTSNEPTLTQSVDDSWAV